MNKKIMMLIAALGCGLMVDARVSIKGAWRKTKEKVSAGAKAAVRKVGEVTDLGKATFEEVGQAFGEGVKVIGKGAGKAVGVVAKPVHKAYHTVTGPVARRLIEPFVKFKQSSHYQEKAMVRVSSDIPQAEKAYLEKRDRVTQDALEKFLGISLGATNIRIAASGSGGGYRAMQMSLGSLIGMEKIGFLNAVTYYVGVSGSTWLAPWFARHESLQGYQNLLIPKLNKDLPGAFFANAKEAGMIFKEMYVRHAYRQPWTGVSLYGAGLTNVLFREFGDRRHQVYLSEVMKNIANGSRPFPILTSVGGLTGYGDQWFEFTPLEVGSTWLNMYIPTWSFGSKFKNGHLVEAAPEYPLGFLMGTCGSAFAINNKELYDMALRGFVGSGSNLDRAIKSLLNIGYIGESRITDVLIRRTSTIRNFTRGMAQSPIRDERTFALRDAGLHYNFDLVSSLRKARGVNILIILDASGGVVAGELRKAESDARKKGIPFPTINYQNIDKRSMSVFKDVKNPDAPLVIYFPRILDRGQLKQAENNSALAGYVKQLKDFDIEKCVAESFCNTFNFKYNAKNAQQLMALSEFNMVANAENLKKEIITWIYERYPQLKPDEPVVLKEEELPAYEEPPSYEESQETFRGKFSRRRGS